jgi:hypothetical protein
MLDAPDPEVLCGALRFFSSAVSRRRSDGLTVTDIPSRMRQTRMQQHQEESLFRNQMLDFI